MKLDGNKKIILLGLILLIIAGIIVVAFKGFNVSLIYQQHENVSFLIGKDVDLKDIKQICKEVFNGKEVVLKEMELFNDSVNISVESITNEEKEQLINKINEKYGTEFTLEGITTRTISNIRIRDLIKPYFKPVILSAVLIIVYLIIRFRKSNIVELLGTIAVVIILTEALLASIIAIVRLPLSPVMINLMMLVAVVELLVYINKKEVKKEV